MAFSKTLKSKRHKKAQDNTKYQKGNIFVNFVPFWGAIESASQFRLWTGVFAPGLDKSLEIV